MKYQGKCGSCNRLLFDIVLFSSFGTFGPMKLLLKASVGFAGFSRAGTFYKSTFL